MQFAIHICISHSSFYHLPWVVHIKERLPCMWCSSVVQASSGVLSTVRNQFSWEINQTFIFLTYISFPLQVLISLISWTGSSVQCLQLFKTSLNWYFQLVILLCFVFYQISSALTIIKMKGKHYRLGIIQLWTFFPSKPEGRFSQPHSISLSRQ